MQYVKRSLTALAIAAAAAGIALAQLGTATAASCVPRQNIELILDDSGSMSGFDSGKLRVAGSKLLLEKPANQQKTFGAVQFGSDASTVFAPAVVAPGLAAMESALDAQIQADDGSTNYNAAFDKAGADNPKADSRIFLTDGGHNKGAYLDRHKGGPRTDVIGFGSSTAGENGARLQRIATETGGAYYPQTDATNLQKTMNAIDAIYNCLPIPTEFQDFVTDTRTTKSHALNIKRRTRSLDMVLTWIGPGNEFDLVSARIVRGKRVVAQSRRKRKPRKLRITRKRGATFVAIKISRVKKGRLKFRLKARRLAAPAAVVTQVTQSSKR
jgi:hypothetical protein